MKTRSLLILATFGLLGVAIWPGSYANSHGFGDRYDLPVPLWLYLYGAAAVVLVSFVLIGMFLKTNPAAGTVPRYNLLRHRWLRSVLEAKLFLTVLRIISLSTLGLIIATAFWGNESPTLNFSVVFIWVAWWVGLGYVFSFIGNFWALLNPWKVAFEWVGGLYCSVTGGKTFGLEKEFPNKLGVTPAIVLFFGFAWIENVYINAAEPKHLGFMVVVYSTINLFGMFVFGKNPWLHYGEAFSVLYRFLSKFAITEVRVINKEFCSKCEVFCDDTTDECVNCYDCYERAAGSRELNIRPPGLGLSYLEKVGSSEMIFVILALATVTFDGFTETSLWIDIKNGIFPGVKFYNNDLTGTLALIIVPLIFIGIYLLFSYFVTILSKREVSTWGIASAFVHSLIPIALAYNVAHFFSFLAIQGQLVVKDASDPFGRGWDLFGTADFQIDISIVSARLVWFVGVAAIVIGHVIAVYVAHAISMKTINSRSEALRSQYPMVVLMVGYTVISLWIIAQPITFEA